MGNAFHANQPDVRLAKIPVAGLPDGSPVLAASMQAQPRAATITTAQAQPVLAQALARWQAAGVDTSGLGNLQIQITNLGGRTLGLAVEL